MWVIKLKDDDKFIKLERGFGKPTLTTNYRDCKTFRTEDDATFFIENSISKKQRYKYIPANYVPDSIKLTKQSMNNEKSVNNVNTATCKASEANVHISTSSNTEPIQSEAQELLSENDVDMCLSDCESIKCDIDSLNFDYAKLFKCLQVILDNAPNHYKECLDRFHKCELALTDIRHYIEFTDLSVTGGYKIYKYQQDLLRLRRKLKDEIKVTEIILNDLVNKDAKAHNVVNFLSIKQSRAYCPRVLNNLFTAGINKLSEDSKESI